MSAALRAALEKLRTGSPSGELAASKFSKSQSDALEMFGRQTRSVERVNKGRGVVFRITNFETFEKHYQHLVPIAADTLPESLSNRATNIAATRNSKSAAHHHDAYYLLIKAIGEPIWLDDYGNQLSLNELTAQAGAGVIKIQSDDDPGWHSDAPIWLVENQALFDRLDWLPKLPPASIAYYQGHLRTALVDWLASRSRTPDVIFFPDYDGVGLQNYVRLRRAVGDAVSFWLMPDWETRLKQFGNNALWKKTNSSLIKAAKTPEILANADLTALVRQMQALGYALEQESIWLPTDKT